MPTKELSAAPPKPTLPPFWKNLMRVTFAFTLLLFLTPTFYALKYYALDKPREEAYASRPHAVMGGPNTDIDALPQTVHRAQDRRADQSTRLWMIEQIGDTLRLPYISIQHPIECLSAKAALSSLATRDPDPAVRAAASEELGKVAQGGAVIQR